MHAPARPHADHTTRCELAVKELDCASCAAHVEEALRDLAGVQAVQADVMRGRVRVDYDARTATTDAISAAIARIGYTPAPVAPAGAPTPAPPRDPRLVATVVAAALLVPGLVLEWLDSAPTVAIALLAGAMIAGGWFVAPRAVKSARAGILDMHVLMTIAAAGAAIIGEWGEGASAMTLFGVAQWLEARAMSRARAAIAALLDVAPTMATVVHDDHEHVVPADRVRVGALVLVRPGEKIPVDGAVEAGRGAVQQAAITGEPLPVDKAPGDPVYAGTINGDGVLRIRAERTAQDTTLARILHAVEEAQASRAPTQRFVDRFAQRYTPAVVVLAVLLAVVPPLASGAEWRPWMERALAMLVVACPCALVISTPVTIVSALAAGARAGLLLKGGTALESLATVTTVAFDKTGTLTEGRAVVSDVVPLGDADEADVWRAAVPVERVSTHPVARAIAAHGAARLAALGAGRAPAAHDAQALPGRGAEGTVDGARVRVGTPRLLGADALTADARATLDRLEADGKTAIVVEADARVLGIVAVSDRVRDEAPAALRALHDAGIREVAMLTGDHARSARAVGARLGVDAVEADLLPEDKVRHVRDRVARGERVAMVGDGINDAPALAAAHVGIAMGAAGSAVAIETADAALMGDDLRHLAFGARLARRTLAVVRQNVAVALGSKLVFLGLAGAGVATLWMAVAADTGASLLVVANGLRLLRARPSHDDAPARAA